MKCPHCDYEPEINEFDYAMGAGRFYTLGIEMKQEANAHSNYHDAREAVYGCPSCGVVFINV